MSPRGKFIALNAYVRKEKTIFYFMKLEKRRESESQSKKEKNKDKIIKSKAGSSKNLTEQIKF